MNQVKQLITANPTFQKPKPNIVNFLNVSEFFCDTIQGEGINTGCPATFLRLQDCTLNCIWCDTRSVWRHGNPYTFDQLFELMEKFDLPTKFKEGQHLVLTGGSPLKQQEKLLKFLQKLIRKYKIIPIIEIENECVIEPLPELIDFVSTWNNSPKLKNSGNPLHRMYNPTVISFMSKLRRSWFKFVVRNDEDWNEIKGMFLVPNLIQREQIILMPEGANRERLISNTEKVVEIAIRENVRYCTREHIMLWDQATGV